MAAPVEGGENPEDLIDSPSEREKTPLPPRSMKGNVKYGSAAEMEAEAMNRVLLERVITTTPTATTNAKAAAAVAAWST